MADGSKTAFLGTINREFAEREVEQQAEAWGIGYVDLSKYQPNWDALKLVSAHEAETAQVIPLSKLGKKLRLAVVDPENKPTKTLIARWEDKGWKVERFACSEASLRDGLKFYQADALHKKAVKTKQTFTEDKTETLRSKIGSLADLDQKLASMPAKTALSEIELTAVSAGASDIHFQPQKNGMTLRFRVDGVLHDVLELTPDTAKKITTRIKYEAGMRSNIANTPQDGHLSFPANGRMIDLRISTLPTPFGESVVMRVLDSERGIQTFVDLGFAPTVRDKMFAALKQSNGLILVTGPTGSGKTTTLYSMLAELNDPEKKLVTLEDPIEYQLQGVSQSQVNEEREYNFETGLKALLRHDPDVILVGEIRTLKTARLAAEAALTGHVVLSSLHTNSAIAAIARLRNLGLENFNIAPTLNAVFAQRLIRKCDPECIDMVPLPSDPQVKAAITRLQKVMPDLVIPEKIPRVVRKTEQSETGYHGRLAICEAFIVTDPVRKMIVEGKSDLDVLEYVRERTDFLTLFEDGILKVLAGETTLEEVYRVVGG